MIKFPTNKGNILIKIDGTSKKVFDRFSMLTPLDWNGLNVHQVINLLENDIQLLKNTNKYSQLIETLRRILAIMVLHNQKQLIKTWTVLDDPW